jgi:hypothetical protein
MIDCHNCREYKKRLKNGNLMYCYNEPFFLPSEEMYCRPQNIIYLRNAETFREGRWIPQPEGSSYVDPAIRSKQVKIPSKAAEDLAAEIDWRLNRLPGIERKLLETEAIIFDDISEWSTYSKDAMNYICGWKRRDSTFSEFKRDKKYRLKTKRKTGIE